MRAIFISYRRDDAEGQAGRLFDDLTQHFGDDSVFMDVAAIEPGRDFRRAIDEQVASCGVLLAIIGKNWLTAKDESGARRLDDPMDFVRLETASALKRDIPVVPVLVHGASMPRAEELPEDLKELAFRNAVELTHARWDSDVQVLVKALRSHLGSAQSRPTGTEDSRTAELKSCSMHDRHACELPHRCSGRGLSCRRRWLHGVSQQGGGPGGEPFRGSRSSPPLTAKPEPATKPLGGDKSSAPDNGALPDPLIGMKVLRLPLRESQTKASPGIKVGSGAMAFLSQVPGTVLLWKSQPGVCPADNQPHEELTSGKYVVTFGESVAPVMASASHPASSGLQGGWRFCHKCQGLFFAGNPSQGIALRQPPSRWHSEWQVRCLLRSWPHERRPGQLALLPNLSGVCSSPAIPDEGCVSLGSPGTRWQPKRSINWSLSPTVPFGRFTD